MSVPAEVQDQVYETLRKNASEYENTMHLKKPNGKNPTAIIGLPGFSSPRAARKSKNDSNNDAMALYARVDRSKKKKNRDSGSSGSSPTSPTEEGGPSSKLSPTKTLINKFNSIGLTNSHHTISCNTSKPQAIPAAAVKDGKSKLAVIKINKDESPQPGHKHVIRVTSNPNPDGEDTSSAARYRPTTLYSTTLHQNRVKTKSTTSLNHSPPATVAGSQLGSSQAEPMYATIGSSNKRMLSSLKSANV